MMSTAVKVSCPHCSVNIKGPSSKLGHKINCPSCKKPFLFNQLIPQKEFVLTCYPATTISIIIYCLKFILTISIITLISVFAPTEFPLGILGIITACIIFAWTFSKILLVLLKSRFEKLVITSTRCIYEQGIFSKNISEVRHKDIKNIISNQSIFERFFNIGSISVSSSAQSDIEIYMRQVGKPKKIIDTIRSFQD